MKRKMDSEGSEPSENGKDQHEFQDSGGESAEFLGSESSFPSAEIAVGIVTSPTFSSIFSVTPSLSSSSRLSSPTTRTSITSTQEERRACRRHKRRLARIVAEQWKYVARSRLLSVRVQKFQQVQVTRTTFLEWKELVKDKASRTEKADKLFQSAFLRRSFRLWMKYVKRSKEIHHAMLEFSSSARRYRGVFVAWHDYTDMRIVQRKRTITADHYYMISSLSKCFSDWRLVRQIKRQKAFYKKVAHAKWDFSQQRFALRAWKAFVDKKSYKAMVTKSWQHKTLSKCINSWHNAMVNGKLPENESSVDSLLEKAQEDMLLLVVESHFRRKRQKNVLREWWRLASSHRATKLTVDMFYHHSFLKRSFHYWMEYHFRKKSQHEQEESALNHFHRNVLKGNFHYWMEYHFRKKSQHDQGESALNHCHHNCLKRNFHYWMEYHSCKRYQDAQGQSASSHWRACRLRRCIQYWYLRTAESKRRHGMEQKAADRRMKMTVKASFYAWMQLINTQKEKRTLRREQFTRLKLSLDILKLAKVWKSWEEFSRLRNVKRLRNARADCLCRRWRALSVMRAWRCFHEEQQAQRISNTQAELFYARLLQRLALLGWFQVQKSKPVSRESRSPQALSKDNQVNPPSARHVVRVRPAPRRPSFLFNDLRQSPVFDTSSLSRHSLDVGDVAQAYLSKHEDPDYQFMRRFNGEMKDISNLHSRTTNSSSRAGEDHMHSHDSDGDSQLIADEIAWMEDILANFDDLRAELVQKRAELALLLEKNGPCSKENAAKMHVLSQKVSLLQQRRAILIPTIQAVASIIPALRLRARKFSSSKGEQKSMEHP